MPHRFRSGLRRKPACAATRKATRCSVVHSTSGATRPLRRPRRRRRRHQSLVVSSRREPLPLTTLPERIPLSQATNIPCEANDRVGELLRGIRQHFNRFIKGLKDGDLQKAQLGLAHSYSRAKVKFNVNRADNMIIQAIALIDTLDKARRCRLNTSG